MQYLYDDEDKKLLDCIGGIVTVNCGHCHPKVKAALHGQMDKLWHCSNVFLHEPVAEYRGGILEC